MLRLLNSYESFFWLLGREEPFLIQYTLAITGTLDEKWVTQALALLQQQHPLLNCSVTVERPFALKPTTLPVPLYLQDRTDDDDWRRQAIKALEQPLPAAGDETFLRVDWLRGEKEHEFIFTIEHAFSDFRSVTGLCVDFLGFLDALQSGRRDIKLTYYPLLPAIEKMLPQQMPPAKAAELQVSYGDGTRVVLQPPYHYQLPHSNVLSNIQSMAILHAAKANQCSVQGVLCSAMMHTLDEYLQQRDMFSDTFCFTPSDFRPYIKAEIHSKELGNFVTGIFHPFKTGRLPEFWPLARKITTQLKCFFQDDKFVTDTKGLCSLYHPDMTSEQAVAIMKAREGCAFVSNAGVTPFLDKYDNFRLCRTHTLAASPMLSGREHLFWLGVQTINGRMQLELLDTAAQDDHQKLERFMQHFLDTLKTEQALAT